MISGGSLFQLDDSHMVDDKLDCLPTYLPTNTPAMKNTHVTLGSLTEVALKFSRKSVLPIRKR